MQSAANGGYPSLVDHTIEFLPQMKPEGFYKKRYDDHKLNRSNSDIRHHKVPTLEQHIEYKTTTLLAPNHHMISTLPLRQFTGWHL